jgi:hypothetical protein
MNNYEVDCAGIKNRDSSGLKCGPISVFVKQDTHLLKGQVNIRIFLKI